MSCISTYVANLRRYPTGSAPEADARINLKSEDGGEVELGNLKFEIDSPEGVNIEVGNAREVEPDVWVPAEPAQSGELISYPIFLNLQPWKREFQGTVNVSVIRENSEIGSVEMEFSR
jgi:hypothetical protein